MSEFKFACPNCQQNISATKEHSGLQINCPSCKTLLVVPADPSAPAAPAGKLTMAASTASHAPSSAAAAATFYAPPVRKKKPKTGLIVGISLAAIGACAAVYFWPEITKLATHTKSLAVADSTPTNEPPPPPPPPLTTEEILEKVGDAYKSLTDYAAKANTEASIDMSAVAPGRGNISLRTTSALQLGRTNFYRLEWEQNASGKTTTGSAWNSGKGNFIGYSVYPPSKVKTRQEALQTAGATFYLLSGGIADLFFAESNSLAADAKDFTKTNGADLNNGQQSYVLVGEANHQSVLLWINKQTFLVSQIQVNLGGTIPPDELKKMTSSQRNLAMMISKLKGSITETYSQIQTNQNLMASAFESAYKPTVSADAPQPMPRSKRASSMAGQLTNPRRQTGQ